MYSNSDKNLCNALAAYHAFMGSGLATFFSWKGKIELLKKLEKDVEAQIVFRHLGVLDDDQSNDFTKVEKFTWKMYGKKKLKKKIFMESYKPNIRWWQNLLCQKT